MRILILMTEGFDRYGPSRHLYLSLIEDLINDGNKITIVQNFSFGPDKSIPDIFSKNENINFITISQKKPKKRQFVRRYLYELRYLSKMKKIIRKKTNDFDIVFVQSLVCAPFLIPFLHRRFNAKIVWNIQDMFPGSSIANGVLKNSILKKIFYKLHKKAYKNSDYITVISEDMADKVSAQGFEKNKITVIYDWFDDSSVHEIPWHENLFVKKYNMKDDIFYVQFAGTMGFNFDYKMVIKVANLLKNDRKIVFQMVGFGSQLDIFMKEAEELQLSNIVFLPLQEQKLVSHVYSSCSCCIIPLPYGVIGNSVPSKIGLLMACKRAVISTADKNSKYIAMINNNKLGFGFGTDDVESVANAIRYLSDNKNECIEMGINGYNYGSIIYSRHYNTKKYIDFFKKICK